MTLCSEDHPEICWEQENGGCPVCHWRRRAEELTDALEATTARAERLASIVEEADLRPDC